MSYFLTSDNVKLFYQVTGRGKTILFIHGWSACHEYYQKQIDAFSKDYQVVVYDLRGHGISENPTFGHDLGTYARDLKELMDHLDLRDIVLVGWSMGVHVLYEYIRQYGCDNLRKICTVDQSAKFCTDETWDLGLYMNYPAKDVLVDLDTMSKNWITFADLLVPALFAKNTKATKEDLKWYYEKTYNNSTDVMVRMWLAMALTDYRELLGTISVPALITCGKEDVGHRLPPMEYQVEKIPDARLVVFDNCGHTLFAEDPVRFNAVLKAFIEE